MADKPMTQRELRDVKCADPKCQRTAHDFIQITGKCHPGAPMFISYSTQDGVLDLFCAECDLFHDSIQVATGSIAEVIQLASRKKEEP